MKTSPLAHCEEIRQNISAFVDGELTKSERSIVEGHLRECGGCRDRLAELSRVVSMVSALPQANVGPDFLAQVRARTLRAPSIWDRIMEGLSQQAALSGISMSLASAVCVVVLWNVHLDGGAVRSGPSDEAGRPAVRVAHKTAARPATPVVAQRGPVLSTEVASPPFEVAHHTPAAPAIPLPVDVAKRMVGGEGVLEPSQPVAAALGLRSRGVVIMGPDSMPLTMPRAAGAPVAAESPVAVVQGNSELGLGTSGSPELATAPRVAEAEVLPGGIPSPEVPRGPDLNEPFKLRPGSGRTYAALRGEAPSPRTWVPDAPPTTVEPSESRGRFADRVTAVSGASTASPAAASASVEPVALDAARIRPFLPAGVTVDDRVDADLAPVGDIQVFVVAVPPFLQQMGSLVSKIPSISYQVVHTDVNAVEVVFKHTGQAAEFLDAFNQVKEGVGVLPTVRSSGASCRNVDAGSAPRTIRVRVSY
jgi:hypothetical protein